MAIQSEDLLPLLEKKDQDAIARFWNNNAPLFVTFPERSAERRSPRITGAFDPVSEANLIYFEIIFDRKRFPKFPETGQEFERVFKEALHYRMRKEAKYNLEHGKHYLLPEKLGTKYIGADKAKLEKVKLKLFGDETDISHPDYKMFLEDMKKLALTAIMKALGKASPQTKAALRLYHIEGLSDDEIAAELGALSKSPRKTAGAESAQNEGAEATHAPQPSSENEGPRMIHPSTHLYQGRRKIYEFYGIDEETGKAKPDAPEHLIRHHENIKFIFAPVTGVHGISPLIKHLEEGMELKNHRSAG